MSLLLNHAGFANWKTRTDPIFPTAANVADSLTNIQQVIGTLTATRTNVNGRLIVNVPSGTTTLDIWLASNVQTFVGYDFAVGVFVDGTYNTEFLPAFAAIPGIQKFTLTLDGLAHIVEIWTGFQNYLTGTYVYAVQGTGISFGTPVEVTRRLTVYGDSIAGGAAASPVSQLGWFGRLRAVFPGAIAQEAFGGRQLFDDCGTGSGQIGFPNVAALAARLVALNQNAPNRAIWLAIGINDVGAGHWDAATFGTNYAALLDAIHAADPTCQVYAQSMLITTTSEGGAPAFRTAIQNACSGRSWVTFVDGTTLMTTGGLAFDGLHPSTAGHATVFSAIRAILGV